PRSGYEALPWRIVGLVQSLLAYGSLQRGVKQRDIGIAAHGNRTFAWIETHDPRGVGRCQFDEFLQRVAAALHHFGIHHREPGLHPRISASRIVDALALHLDCERAADFVRGHGLYHSVAETVPQGALIGPRLERGIRVINLAVWSLIVVRRVHQVLMQSFAV